ncbi:MAG: glycoside hydrolase family 2 protein [Anaerolineae bacterium]|nr:glycoside hydrolase family 2 protein [Anaerolineae bacterium]
MGIWREVELEAHQDARLEAVYFRTEILEPDWAQVAVTVDVERLKAGAPPPRLLVTLARFTRSSETRSIYSGGISMSGTRATIRLRIDEPALWWTHDLGEPALYDLVVYLENEHGARVDRYQTRVGVRTVALDQSPDTDEPGTRFFRVVLNGVPVFAKGANWIPAHSFVGAVDEARYRLMLERARDANMNMLRVWGGGLYEKPDFYRLCDELGLLIWQDFMFACAAYPEDDAFAAEVEAEARSVVRRLRNHPSVALWCGNNENQWIDDQRYWSQYPERVAPGARYYHETLPRVVAEMDPSRPYWPGSPYGGNDFNSMEDGDRHNWCVWHGQADSRRFGEKPERDFSPEGVSFVRYANDMGRFISEFGMHAAPVRETLRRNVPADGLAYNSPQMHHRNKDEPKNKGDNLMRSCTGLPADLDEYIDFSMIAQAEGLKFAVEHFRRRKPHCSGALIWQLNDCWPGLSWSLVDYYGFGKAGYFYARRFFAPVLASFRAEPDGGVSLWVVNDTLEAFEDQAKVRLATFDGATLLEEVVRVRVGANRAAQVYRLSASQLAPATPEATYLSVTSAAGKFPANRHFFVAIKDLKRPQPTLDVSITQVRTGDYRVTVGTDVYAFFVKIETPYELTEFQDNYLDLEPGARRTVRVYNTAQPLTEADIKVACR